MNRLSDNMKPVGKKDKLIHLKELKERVDLVEDNWVNTTERVPNIKEWFVCYIGGERKVLTYNIPNKFWCDLYGKTYKNNEVTKWLDA